ncbi:MAG: hypothetical protein A3H35_01130 [Betaproteobacteria bacterium RIFCSPLOWO2_02_FULL_62_17]|nr:MAG: hypothetical protein A3H35_01130 [Betaproteobacteria bacterium RIFCSPLOWO2_02_FULL_62_17]
MNLRARMLGASIALLLIAFPAWGNHRGDQNFFCFGESLHFVKVAETKLRDTNNEGLHLARKIDLKCFVIRLRRSKFVFLSVI